MQSFKDGKCRGDLFQHEYPVLDKQAPFLRRIYKDIDVCSEKEAKGIVESGDPNMLIINTGPVNCTLQEFDVLNHSAVHVRDLESVPDLRHNCSIYGSAMETDVEFMKREHSWIAKHCENISLFAKGIEGLRRQNVLISDDCRASQIGTKSPQEHVAYAGQHERGTN